MDDKEFEESFHDEESKDSNPIIGKNTAQLSQNRVFNNPLPFGKSIDEVMMDGIVVDWNAELRDSEDFQMAIEQTGFMHGIASN